MDRGLISRKPRGSLAKRARRTGILRSGSLDLNPMAQGGSVLDLIWAACLGSDGQGGLGCWATALNAGVGFRGGGFAGVSESGVLGAD